MPKITKHGGPTNKAVGDVVPDHADGVDVGDAGVRVAPPPATPAPVKKARKATKKATKKA